jgi:hypothetical protein
MGFFWPGGGEAESRSKIQNQKLTMACFESAKYLFGRKYFGSSFFDI